MSEITYYAQPAHPKLQSLQAEHVLAPQTLSVAPDGVGNVNGPVYYSVTYVTLNGETEPTSEFNRAGLVAVSNRVRVTIPVSTDGRVIARKIYRSDVTTSYTARHVGTVNNNTETEFFDNLAVESEGARAIHVNTTAGTMSSNGVRYFNADEGSTNVGWDAGKSTAGYHNSNFGYRAGRDQDTVFWQTNLGAYAGEKQARGYECVNVGFKAGYDCVEGYYSTAIGAFAYFRNLTGNRSVAVGYLAGGSATATPDSVYIGAEAGRCNLTGYGSTFLGAYTGRFVDAGATVPVTAAENCVYIGREVLAGNATPVQEIVIGATAKGGGNYTATVGTRLNGATYLKGGMIVDTVYSPELLLRQRNLSTDAIEHLFRLAHDGTNTYYVQVGTSFTNSIAINGTSGDVTFAQNVTFAQPLTLTNAKFAAGAWVSSSEPTPKQRFLFDVDATTYVKGHGSAPVVVRNGSDVDLFAFLSTGAIRLKSGVWHEDGESAARMHYEASGRTYLRAYGTEGFDFYDGSSNRIAQIKPDSFSAFFGGSLKLVEVGAPDSGGTGYRILRVVN